MLKKKPLKMYQFCLELKKKSVCKGDLTPTLPRLTGASRQCPEATKNSAMDVLTNCI